MIYAYRCRKCGEEFEAKLPIGEAPGTLAVLCLSSEALAGMRKAEEGPPYFLPFLVSDEEGPVHIAVVPNPPDDVKDFIAEAFRVFQLSGMIFKTPKVPPSNTVSLKYAKEHLGYKGVEP